MPLPLRSLASRLLVCAFVATALSGCFSGREKIEQLQGDLAKAKARITKYENRYGVLPEDTERRRLDEIQTTLKNARSKELYTALGQPDTVFTLNGRECWVYRDAALDSPTGRAVNYLEFWLRDGSVEEILFSY